jgi:hypothetical protein
MLLTTMGVVVVASLAAKPAFEFVSSASVHDLQAYAQLAGGTLDHLPVGFRSRSERIPQEGHARGSRDRFLQEFEPLALNFGGGIAG